MSRFGEIARGLAGLIPPGLAKAFGRPAAVFFHGVERKTLDPRVQINHHERDAFAAIARTLKAHFDVLPAEALPDALAGPERYPRALFLMSDDGYANTLSEAADILEDLRLPWTLFVSTHHIDSGDRNPIFLTRLFAFYAPEGVYPLPLLGDVALREGERNALADRLEWRLRGLDMDSAQAAVDAMAGAFPARALAELLARFDSERFLDWDGVRALAKRGVAIGAHAHRHWPMNAHQTAEQLARQAAEPKRRIEAEVGPSRFFAYPFGNNGDVAAGAWRAVRDAGYDAAFTTLAGTLDAGHNRFLLPRFGLAPSAERLAQRVSLLRAGNRRVSRVQKALTA